RNPVMFAGLLPDCLQTGPWLQATHQQTREQFCVFHISAWLWFTVLFANFAEAMAEGRGKAQADALRQTRRDVAATKLDEPRKGAKFSLVSAASLRKDDIVLVNAGELVPGDGEIIEGVASVDE